MLYTWNKHNIDNLYTSIKKEKKSQQREVQGSYARSLTAVGPKRGEQDGLEQIWGRSDPI